MPAEDILLPENWSKGSTGGPAFNTLAVALASGAVDREERWEHPLQRYDIAQNIKSVSDMAQVQAFHRARRGASRSFLLKDWLDYTSASDGLSAPSATDQPLGTGDASETVFPLVKRYPDTIDPYDRPILWPVAATVLVAVDGTPTTAFTLQRGDGTVTFDSAPGGGTALTAGFQFHVPVRFVEDLLSVNWDTINSRSLGSVPLEEDRT